MTRRYYHERIRKTLQFIIPSGKRVLFFGPSHEVGAKSGKYKVNGKFDYIILNGVLGKSKDMMRVLTNLQSVCTPETRLIVYQHNFLWQGILSVLEKLNLKRVEGVQNWLSITDLKAYLEAAGFGITRMFRRTLCPAYLGGVGELINYIAAILPIFDPLKLDQFIIARPSPMLFPNGKPESLTICLTVRNEKGNIEKIVRELPKVCKKQEILFVEGHSTDGTREEIERVIKLYSQKNIRVIGQPGRGQGDAIRVGFKDARGDIVILYEGDGTSDTGDIKYFYEAMRERRFEFIEGSRFVYPLDYKSMPLSEITTIEQGGKSARIKIQFFYKAFPQGPISNESPIVVFSSIDSSLINELSGWDSVGEVNFIPLVPSVTENSSEEALLEASPSAQQP